MTESQKLILKSSEQRARLNVLSAAETLTGDERAELDTLTEAYQTTEAQLRAAVLAEAEAGDRTETHATPDGEDRERLALRKRVSIGGYIAAALDGKRPAASWPSTPPRARRQSARSRSTHSNWTGRQPRITRMRSRPRRPPWA